MISDKQSPSIVRRQRDHALKALAKKRDTLNKTTSKSHVTRLKLEIAEYERRIAEYNDWLRSR